MYCKRWAQVANMLLKLLLHLNVLWVRSITGLSSIVDRYLIKPIPPQSSFQLKIPAHTSKQKGFITLLFYTPAKSNFGGTPRPVIINFHGGGWIFGTPQLDARWAARVVHEGAVLISVGYRLAPSYPYPTPIQDCVDAIKWVYANAEKYNLDRDKIALSGFSAGGNMVFAAAMMLHAKREHDIKLQAIVSFYPLLDRTKTREEKYEGNGIAEAKVSTPKRWDKLYADCYLGTEKVDFTSPYLSPGLASDELLRECLPKKCCGFHLHLGRVVRGRGSIPGKAYQPRKDRWGRQSWRCYSCFW